MAACVLDLLVNPQLLKMAQDEHRDKLAGRNYKPPIPPDLKPPLNMFATKP
jgi:hypothetical protein